MLLGRDPHSRYTKDQQHCNGPVIVATTQAAHPHIISATHSARLGRLRYASPQHNPRWWRRPMARHLIKAKRWQVTSWFHQARATIDQGQGSAGQGWQSSRALVWCRPASRALRRGNAIGAACTAPATGDDSCIRTPHRQPATSPSSQRASRRARCVNQGRQQPPCPRRRTSPSQSDSGCTTDRAAARARACGGGSVPLRATPWRSTCYGLVVVELAVTQERSQNDAGSHGIRTRGIPSSSLQLHRVRVSKRERESLLPNPDSLSVDFVPASRTDCEE